MKHSCFQKEWGPPAPGQGSPNTDFEEEWKLASTLMMICGPIFHPKSVRPPPSLSQSRAHLGISKCGLLCLAKYKAPFFSPLPQTPFLHFYSAPLDREPSEFQQHLGLGGLPCSLLSSWAILLCPQTSLLHSVKLSTWPWPLFILLQKQFSKHMCYLKHNHCNRAYKNVACLASIPFSDNRMLSFLYTNFPHNLSFCGFWIKFYPQLLDSKQGKVQFRHRDGLG